MEITTIELYGRPFIQQITLKQAYRLPKEMKNDACLAYVQTGTQEVYSPTQKLVAKDNESILMKCGNYIANLANVSPTSQFKSVVVHLDPESIKCAFAGKDLSFLRMKKTNKIINPGLKIDNCQLLDSYVTSLMLYINNPKLANDELLSVKLQELVYILSESGKNSLVTQIIGTLYSPEKFAFDEIISANIYNNLSIKELAYLSVKSVSGFKREFKKWYKKSPAKYFKEKRLEKAANLLKKTTLSVSEIAWECGFENAAHFSTSFNSYYGNSPKKFRI